ncbi:epoxide hydrolase family protein [Nocardia testacea]|uniref:epoxide hydrolase family protein n=1 Tax=Nocardia testacea TaxID=248551 RepID=UPI0002E664FB|nr:epoxide hydrolase [Nocardia testacea]
MPAELTPFTIAVPERELTDLRARIRATRWPDRETVSDWSQGVPLQVMRDLAGYWAEEYDWRRFERRMARIPQYLARIDGLDIHFLHVRSPHRDALPLVVTHGWPGSFVEFLDILEPLTDPPDGARAFHLVVPSVPGYGFSSRPAVPGWGIERIARTWARLMEMLGYSRYGATGGDWGTSISTMLGVQDSEHVCGIHLTPPLVAPDPATFDSLTESERAGLEVLENAADGSGYAAMHSTRPQTLGYALADSPVGQAAWILEKFWAWADHGGDLFSVLDRDRVLDNITLYWLTGTGTSATRLYWESFPTVDGWFTEGTTDSITVPTGAAIFRDTPRPSRRWAERRFTDIRYWSEPGRGGHFAAFEQPQLFVGELRASFDALLRSEGGRP